MSWARIRKNAQTFVDVIYILQVIKFLLHTMKGVIKNAESFFPKEVSQWPFENVFKDKTMDRKID